MNSRVFTENPPKCNVCKHPLRVVKKGKCLHVCVVLQCSVRRCAAGVDVVRSAHGPSPGCHGASFRSSVTTLLSSLLILFSVKCHFGCRHLSICVKSSRVWDQSQEQRRHWLAAGKVFFFPHTKAEVMQPWKSVSELHWTIARTQCNSHKLWRSQISGSKHCWKSEYFYCTT